jgi:hypothetical protein
MCHMRAHRFPPCHIGRMTKAKASWGSVRKLPSGRYHR